MNIPNELTIVRFFLVPIFVKVFFSNSEHNLQYALAIFIIAGITDVLDGYIARKYNLTTKWGQAMDPLADKCMQIAAIVCLTIKNLLPAWFIIVFISKELCMIAGAIFLYVRKEKIVVPANIYGKIATVMIYGAVVTTSLKLPYNYLFVGIAVISTVFAFIKYLIGFKMIVKSKG